MDGRLCIYGLKTCDTCRRVMKDVQAAGRAAALRDVRQTPLDAAERARFLDAFGPALINRRSATWRGLSEAERSASPADLLAAHPALMKRPVIEANGVLYLGWDAGVKSALL